MEKMETLVIISVKNFIFGGDKDGNRFCKGMRDLSLDVGVGYTLVVYIICDNYSLQNFSLKDSVEVGRFDFVGGLEVDSFLDLHRCIFQCLVDRYDISNDECEG